MAFLVKFHFIIGKGIPLQLSQDRFTTQMSATNVLGVEHATQEYERETGGHLAPDSFFGSDPLEGRADLINIRNRMMTADIGTYDMIFTNSVSGNGILLERAIIHFISVSLRLAH